VMVEIGERVRRLSPREPAAGEYTTLIAPVPRDARRALRRGGRMTAKVTAIAADDAANTTARRRLVTLGH
jgi:hypothetical protein